MITIKKVTDAAFRPYGKVLTGYDISELEKAMQNTPMPAGVGYEPSIPELEAVALFEEMKNQVYGGMPMQFGYCNGTNDTLNALEYHRDIEVDICFSDVVLLLGKEQDIDPETFEYDTANVEAFLAPKGSVVLLYGTSLHYAPVGKEFRVCIVLPKDTNTDLKFQPAKEGEPKLLTHTNKWLIAHPEAGIEGAFAGLKGENIKVAL